MLASLSVNLPALALSLQSSPMEISMQICNFENLNLYGDYIETIVSSNSFDKVCIKIFELT